MPYPMDLYKAKIYFNTHSQRYKTRPVLVINYNPTNNICTIVEITGTPPQNPPKYYDEFKEEIKRWKEYGLNKPSYIKCKNIHNINARGLNQKIGTMSEFDFNHFVEIIANYN